MPPAPIAIPSAAQCLFFAGPIVVLMAAWWLFRNSDRIIDTLFPGWEWEKKLGWLNIRTNRRAETVLRGMEHLLHALLAFSLYGMVWAASVPADLAQSDDPIRFADGMAKVSTLLVCLGFWLVYLGWELVPRLKRQHEREELERYRAENPGLGHEGPHSARPASPLSPSTIEIWSHQPPGPEQRRY